MVWPGVLCYFNDRIAPLTKIEVCRHRDPAPPTVGMVEARAERDEGARVPARGAAIITVHGRPPSPSKPALAPDLAVWAIFYLLSVNAGGA